MYNTVILWEISRHFFSALALHITLRIPSPVSQSGILSYTPQSTPESWEGLRFCLTVLRPSSRTSTPDKYRMSDGAANLRTVCDDIKNDMYHLRTLLPHRDVQPVSCLNLNAIALARTLEDRAKYNCQSELFLLTCEWYRERQVLQVVLCAGVNRSATEFTSDAVTMYRSIRHLHSPGGSVLSPGKCCRR
jgi:hypothetical protein